MYAQLPLRHEYVSLRTKEIKLYLNPLKDIRILCTLSNFNSQMPQWHQNLEIIFPFYNVRNVTILLIFK